MTVAGEGGDERLAGACMDVSSRDGRLRFMKLA